MGYETDRFCSEADYLDCDRLVFTLGHAYNDLKSLLFWLDVNRELMPDAPKIGTVDKRFGQACGIDGHIFRLMSGRLVEILELLVRERPSIESQFFVETIVKLEDKNRDSWRSLCELAWRQDNETREDLTKLHRFIVRIRANGTFHYYNTKALSDGFVGHFEGPETPESQLDYTAYGKALEESRFFFADAAVSNMCSVAAGGQLAQFQNRLNSYLVAAHFSFRGIVKQHMRRRGIAFRELE